MFTFFYGAVCGLKVIEENGLGNENSNPQWDWLAFHFALISLGRHESIFLLLPSFAKIVALFLGCKNRRQSLD